MNDLDIVPVPLPEERIQMRGSLKSLYREICARTMRRIPRSSFFPTRLLTYTSALIEYADEAISTGNYQPLFEWVAGRQSFGEDAHETDHLICNLVLQEIEAACERTVPTFSMLSGEIAIRFTQLERIIADPSNKPLFLSADANHDLIDVEVDAIIRGLERKDPATGIHSRAVSLWCQLLSTRMGLSKEFVQYVTRGGLIHDLGKVRIPNEILQAPRRLDDAERKIMESHVTIGHDMLSGFPILRPFESMVRNHHEHFQGGGYPDNLAKEDIPLATRIVTVADCFNAMIGQRPYRKQMSTTAAIQQLLDCRGKQFDIDVVDTMVEINSSKLKTEVDSQTAESNWSLNDYWTRG